MMCDEVLVKSILRSKQLRISKVQTHEMKNYFVLEERASACVTSTAIMKYPSLTST